MQTSAMKACFQIAECSLSSAKIQSFGQSTKYLGEKVDIRLSILGERDLGHALIAITLCMKDSALYIYKIGVRGM